MRIKLELNICASRFALRAVAASGTFRLLSTLIHFLRWLCVDAKTFHLINITLQI